MMSQWRGAVNWAKGNKQAIVNIIGVYMVFSYSIHNYRVKLAWDEREEEFRKVEDELARVRAGLSDDGWAVRAGERVKEVVRQPRLGTDLIAAALRAEVASVLYPLHRTKEEIVKEKMTQARGDSTNAELGSLLGSIVTGSVDSKTSGKGGGDRLV
jgi:hypothetical protein